MFGVVIAWLSLGIVSLIALGWAVLNEPEYLDTAQDHAMFGRTHFVLTWSVVGLVSFAVWTMLIALGHFGCLTGGAA